MANLHLKVEISASAVLRFRNAIRFRPRVGVTWVRYLLTFNVPLINRNFSKGGVNLRLKGDPGSSARPNVAFELKTEVH